LRALAARRARRRVYIHILRHGDRRDPRALIMDEVGAREVAFEDDHEEDFMDDVHANLALSHGDRRLR